MPKPLLLPISNAYLVVLPITKLLDALDDAAWNNGFETHAAAMNAGSYNYEMDRTEYIAAIKAEIVRRTNND